MDRRKIRLGLCLLNAAVIAAAVAFLPRQTGSSYSYSSELERVIKRSLYRVPWDQVLAVGVVSLLATFGAHLIIEGWHGSGAAAGENDRLQENS